MGYTFAIEPNAEHCRQFFLSGEILRLPFSVHRSGYAVINAGELPFDSTHSHAKRSHLVLWSLGKFLGPGEVCHHKDGNKLNDDPSNLEIIDRREHSRHHNLGNRNSVGREVRPETRAKIAAGMKGNQNGAGRVLSLENIEKMRLARKPWTAEQRERMSETQRRRGFTGNDETRRLLSEAARRRWEGRTTNSVSCSICGAAGKKKSSHGRPGH